MIVWQVASCPEGKEWYDHPPSSFVWLPLIVIHCASLLNLCGGASKRRLLFWALCWGSRLASKENPTIPYHTIPYHTKANQVYSAQTFCLLPRCLGGGRVGISTDPAHYFPALSLRYASNKDGEAGRLVVAALTQSWQSAPDEQTRSRSKVACLPSLHTIVLTRACTCEMRARAHHLLLQFP